MEKQIICFFLVICQTTILPGLLQAQEPEVWTIDQANAWQSKQAWIVGCNFIPSTAINELEMLQQETFDTTRDGSEPKTWFHDVYRKDRSPFDEKEVLFIKQITEAN